LVSSNLEYNLQKMMIISIDVGTTHIKAGLFRESGEIYSYASRKNQVHSNEIGRYYYDPDEVFQAVCEVIREVLSECDPDSIETIGITGMAETGLLIDKETGSLNYPFIPWFDTFAKSKIKSISNSIEPVEHFKKTGMRLSYKCAFTKLLWLKDEEKSILDGDVWMGVADYVAYRLTGSIKTDYSLAGRTCAFSIRQKKWDNNFLTEHGLDVSIFPEAQSSGGVVGVLREEGADEIGLPHGIPVCISGHDHVCAAFGVRIAMNDISSEFIVDSIGTAEALTGSIEDRNLGDKHYASGFAFGCDVMPRHLYWMGGLSESGGSIEWIRNLINEPPITYGLLEDMVKKAGERPTGIMFFPYLSGSGSPHSNTDARGAFIGLHKAHRREHILKAVLEGTAYEMEYIRRKAEGGLGVDVDKIAVVGGGTKNLHWLQIKADIYGCSLTIPEISEATLLGAALLAGIGAGIYQINNGYIDKLISFEHQTIHPDEERHQIYRDLYEQKYLKFQDSMGGIE
jgi:sugar (pentulose or hexulose) kinase